MNSIGRTFGIKGPLSRWSSRHSPSVVSTSGFRIAIAGFSLKKSNRIGKEGLVTQQPSLVRSLSLPRRHILEHE